MKAYDRSQPADDAFAITKSDTVDIQNSNGVATVPDAIYVGTGGNITGVTVRGTTVVFKNLPAAYILPQRLKRINATGTTAADLVGMMS